LRGILSVSEGPCRSNLVASSFQLSAFSLATKTERVEKNATKCN
jgi:hypothetical protein